MTYRVEFSPRALRALDKLPPALRAQVVDRAQALASDPRPAGVRRMVGHPTRYRIRVGGDYRIVYRIEDEVLLVYVVRVGHRKDVYKDG